MKTPPPLMPWEPTKRGAQQIELIVSATGILQRLLDQFENDYGIKALGMTQPA